MNKKLFSKRPIQGIICNGLQGFYQENEYKSLKSFRLIQISNECNKFNKNSRQQIQGNDKINAMDKETLTAFTQLTAQNETGCKF